MKKLQTPLLLTILLTILALPSCRKDQADVSDLLKTVPSAASAVVTVNMDKIIADAGCTRDGDKITPGKTLKSALASMNPEGRENLQMLLDGKSGVDLSAALIFAEGAYTYLTGRLSSPSDFKAMVEKNEKGSFSDDNGVDVLREVAVKGNRFWVNLSGGAIDGKRVTSYLELSEKQSAMGQAYAARLTDVEEALTGWGDITALLSLMDFGFQERAMAKVSLETVYENPEALLFTLDFDKGEVEIDCTILNGKGKPAKVAFPLDKIDMKRVEGIGGNAESLFAVAVPQKVIKQVKKSVAGQGASVANIYLEALSCLDGTAALAFNTDGSAYKGVISTDGNNSTLTDFLAQLGKINVTKEGTDLLISNGTLSGGVPVAQLAAPLKGAMLGMNVSLPASGVKRMYGVVSMAAGLFPEEGSLQMKVILATGDKQENSLVTLLKNAR